MAVKTGSSKVARSTRKGGTASSRRHAFQTFSQKISAIKIDPVRRIRRQDDALPSASSSHFFDTLTAYNDLYLSANFVDFARSTSQHSESLPHVLYHQDLIVANLEAAVLKSESDGEDSSLRPLLGLVPQLARDLGVEFEKHFERCVKLMTGVIVRTKNVEVVEWAFEALAYLLKYLSRLLVEDLRPLYTIVAPLLGKESQKYYTTRFMAEAMSFLIRKAKGDSLVSIVQFIARDLSDTCRDEKSNAEQYVNGLRTMFLETCIGVEHTLHTRAEPVLKAILSESLDAQLGTDRTAWQQVVTGTIIGLIHKTKQDTAGPLLQTVQEYIEACAREETNLEFAAILLHTILATRKGNRISDWATPADLSFRLLSLAAAHNLDECYWATLQSIAITIHQAELGHILPKMSSLQESISKYDNGSFFLSFSLALASMGLERFGDLWAQELLKFASGPNWVEHEDEILMTLAKLQDLYKHQGQVWTFRDLPAAASKRLVILLSYIPKNISSEQDSMDTDDEPEFLVRVYGYLDIIKSLDSQSVQKANLVAPLRKACSHLHSAVMQRNLRNYRISAVMGLLLYNLSELSRNDGMDSTLSGMVWQSFSLLGNQHAYLIGVEHALKLNRLSPPPQDSDEFENIFQVLQKNLESPNHNLRGISLDILASICTSKFSEESETFDLMQNIENTAISITTSRNVSMHVRKLGLSFQSGTCGRWGSRLLPNFCFGLLTVKFAPLWEDVIGTLAKIADSKDDVVSNLAFSWLTASKSTEIHEPATEDEDDGPRHVGEFECSNLDFLNRSASKVRIAAADPSATISSRLDSQKKPALAQEVARSQALKLLFEIPQVAEKRSRLLVPLFLEWAQHDLLDADPDDDEDQETDAAQKWTRGDRLAMLKIFARFHNPKVLFKADLVYKCLLELLATGDLAMQTAALECIFTWKLPAIRPYEDNLTNLLNESKFRDEITNFIQVKQDESIIQEDHREQLMPVLLRVLYGRSLSRKSSGSSGKMEGRRISILSSLANFTNEDIKKFVDITLGTLKDVNLVDKTDAKVFKFDLDALSTIRVSPRKQLGFVNMTEDLLKQLGKSLGHVLEPIFDSLLLCVLNAFQISAESNDSQFETENLKSYKMIRQIGFRCINECFGRFPELHWNRYMPAFFKSLVNPRLPNFAVEHSMSKSGLLKVFVTWSGHFKTVLFLQQYNAEVLGRVAECLAVPTVSNDVILDIITLIQNLVVRVEESDDKRSLRTRLISPYIDSYLQKFGGILEKSLPKETLEACVEAVSQLAAYVESTAETKKLLQISLFLLAQPTRRINPKVKSDILRIVYHILPGLLEELDDDVTDKAFKTVAAQFSFFRDRDSRELLAKVLTVFAEKDEELEEVAKFCEDMNTYSMKTLDEPDFGKRLAAFAEINEDRYQVLSLKQWIPVVHNMLFFIRDQEELTTRTNASYCLRRFSERAGSAKGGAHADAYLNALSTILLPAIKNGLRESSELIRMEYVNVLGHIIKEVEGCEVEDMKPLLVDGDEEANFFYNVLHIQQHRRSRAIRRLGEIVEKATIRPPNLAHYLIPLLEHFIYDQDEGAHNLATDAIRTLAIVATHIEWPHYRALFKRYLGIMKKKPGEEKLSIRVISGMADAMLSASQKVAQSKVTGDEDTVMDSTEVPPPVLSSSLPAPEKLEKDILEQLLPQLRTFLQQKDESTVSLRVPVAVVIVKLMRVLSEEALSKNLPPVLTNLCFILRSRDQTSRDLTRTTLTDIATLLGPKYFGFILKELRGALLRGYQLHVLSYTVHAIMLSVVANWEIGSLDYCTKGIMDVVMDDVFGVTASEKEAEGYTNKMKEIKSNKSYDTAELLTSITTLPYLGDIVRPIRAILFEKLNHSMIRKVDELFRRVGLGLTRNKSIKSRDILVFSYEIVEDSYKAASVEEKVKEISIRDEIQQRYILNLKNAKSQNSSDKKNIYWFKLLRFALDTVRNAVQKHEELMTPENLDAWLKVIGDNIRADEDDIKISCMRLLTAIIKVPLSNFDKGAYVFVKDCYHVLQDSPKTSSELAQASLKLLGSILRERRNVEVKPHVLSYILTRIQPDLVEPDRQGLTFNFLKSVLSRRIVVPEVYEVIDEVSKIMIQNHSRGVRESCRGLYFQFLMEYPQSKKKLDGHLEFLVDNLSYDHQEGRESVLEAINLLLSKVGDDLIQQLVERFFFPVVLVVGNDEAEKCREMALVLIKKIFERSDKERMAGLLGNMRDWLGREQKELLRRICFRLWIVYVDVVGRAMKNELAFITEKILEVTKESMIDEDESLMADEVEMELSWEQLYYALQLWAKLVPVFPEEVISGKYAALWTATRACEGFPQVKVQLMATRLTGLFFSEFKGELSELPLQTGKGLELTSEDLYEVAKGCSKLLLGGEVMDELGVQAVRNLVFVGRCFQASGLMRSKPVEDVEENEDGGEWGGITENGTEVNEDEDEDEEDEEGEAGETQRVKRSALSWLVHCINGVIRSDDMIQRKNVTGKKFAIQWIAAMTQIMTVEDLTGLAVKIILPLYSLLEADNEALKDLKPIAQEVLQMMSTKMGTTAYSQAYAIVRSKVTERRRIRRHKRSIQMVTDPERAAKRKMRKHERAKESKREKSKIYRDARKAR